MGDYLSTYVPHYGYQRCNSNAVAFPSVRAVSRVGRRPKQETSDLRPYVLAARDFGAAKGRSPILDQDVASACVPHAASIGWRTKSFFDLLENAAADVANDVLATLDMPNLLAGYNGARRITGGVNGYLDDSGTQIQAWFDYAGRLGLPREHDPDLNLTYDPYRVTENVIDRADVQRAANDVKLLDGIHRIDGMGLGRLEVRDAVDEALSNGEPVIFGTALDRRFFELAAGAVYRRELPLIGYHAMALVGHDKDTYRVVNSWSERWCDGGFGLVSKAWFLDEASDVHRFGVVSQW
jgi:Papain family cysteine protease